MNSWETFEEEVFKHLRRHYSDSGNIIYKQLGSSNSKVLDIEVTGKKGGKIYIEVKKAEAQAGQFVLNFENDRFLFEPSPHNLTPSSNQLKLINIINGQNILRVDQNAIIIGCDPSLSCALVKEHYRSKNAKYFVSGKVVQKKFIGGITPIDNLCEAFEFKVNLRRKKSGTRSLPLGFCLERLNLEVAAKFFELERDIQSLKRSNGKVFLTLKDGNSLKKSDLYLELDTVRLYFSQTKENTNKYEVKVTSNTNNVNVVYSSKYLYKIEQKWIDHFEMTIKGL